MFTSLSARFKEIDEYWDRENQYIKDSGIYTPEEVEQILANHEEIRRNQREEASAKFNEEVQRFRDERAQHILDMGGVGYIDPDDLEFDEDMGGYDSDDSYDYEMLRAMREERDAYDDFIASLDMRD